MQVLLLVTGALAAGINTPQYLPCGRLDWGWRNVWAICGLNAAQPSTGTAVPATHHVMPDSSSPNTVILGTGGGGAGGGFQTLCNSAAPAGLTVRTKCRRALDAYGSLVRLCKDGATVPLRGVPLESALTPNVHAPANHLARSQALAHAAQLCLTPAVPTAGNTCWGLAGWWGVVVAACNIPQAPSAGWGGVAGTSPNQLFGPNTPQYLGPIAPTAPANIPLGAPSIFETTTGLVSIPRDFCAAAGVTTKFNEKAAPFRTSRCRRALDQLGRQAQRCIKSTPTAAAHDYTRHVAAGLAVISANCHMP